MAIYRNTSVLEARSRNERGGVVGNLEDARRSVVATWAMDQLDNSEDVACVTIQRNYYDSQARYYQSVHVYTFKRANPL